jgi:hypothetical protein
VPTLEDEDGFGEPEHWILAAGDPRRALEEHLWEFVARNRGDAQLCDAEARRWARVQIVLASLATVFATAAGATALTKSVPILAAIFAFLAALLAALQGVVRPDKQATLFREQQVSYDDLADDAARLRELDLVKLQERVARTRFEKLADHRTQLARRFAGQADAGPGRFFAPNRRRRSNP